MYIFGSRPCSFPLKTYSMHAANDLMSRCFHGLRFAVHVQTRENALIGDDDSEYAANSEGIEKESVPRGSAPERLSSITL